jgi:hypothetical protein
MPSLARLSAALATSVGKLECPIDPGREGGGRSLASNKVRTPSCLVSPLQRNRFFQVMVVIVVGRWRWEGGGGGGIVKMSKNEMNH